MPSLSTYHLSWVSLTLDVGYLFTAVPAKCSRCSLPWTWGSSSQLRLCIVAAAVLVRQRSPREGSNIPWIIEKAREFRKISAAAKSLQSCLTLCDPIDGSPPGPRPWDSPVHLNAALLFLFSILIIITAMNIFGGKLLSSSLIHKSRVTDPKVCILLVKFTY